MFTVENVGDTKVRVIAREKLETGSLMRSDVYVEPGTAIEVQGFELPASVVIVKQTGRWIEVKAA